MTVGRGAAMVEGGGAFSQGARRILGTRLQAGAGLRGAVIAGRGKPADVSSELTRVADKHQTKLAQAILDTLTATQDLVDEPALVALMAQGDRDAVERFMAREDIALSATLETMRAAAFDADGDEVTTPLENAMLSVAQGAADATQCAVGGPISPKVAKSKADVSDAQMAEIFTKYKQGVKKAQLQTDYNLTSSQLTTVIYKQEVNLFPAEKISTIWADIKAGMSNAELQSKYDLTLSQIQMVSSKVKNGVVAIKQQILAPPIAPPAPVKPSIPKPYGAKEAAHSPSHPSKKEFEHFWLEKKQYHGFTDAEIAWNTQTPLEDLPALFAKGAEQAAKYKPPPGYTPGYTPPSYAKPAAPPPVAAPQAFDYTKIKQTPPGEWPIGPEVPRYIGTQYPDHVKQAYASWERSLSKIESSAIVRYTGSDYININTALRAEKTVSANSTAVHIQKALDKAKSLGTPPPPELVWRGLSNSGSQEWASKLASGDEFVMHGFQSTSISPKTASDWASGNVVFEIKPIAGAYVQPISAHSGEMEFLLPHGAKYRVRGMQKIKINTGGKGVYERIEERTVIQLEMIP